MSVSPASISPIFIVGCGRSGTTLLRAILSGHPRITIPPETHFLQKYKFYSPPHCDLTRKSDFDAFWATYAADKWFPRMGLAPEDVLACIEAKGPRTYRTIFESLMECYARKTGKPRWGEKTPGHELHLAEIFKWYPGAKVIFMIRDPRGAAASLQKTPWGKVGVYAHAWTWNQSVQAYERWKDGPRIMTLFFESLLRQPEKEIRRVCEFIGEEFADSMLNRSEQTMLVAKRQPSWSQDHEKHTLKPITPVSIDKWRSQLTGFQVALIEHLTEPDMLSVGYQRTTTGLSRSQSLCWACIRFYLALRRLARTILPRPILRMLGKA